MRVARLYVSVDLSDTCVLLGVSCAVLRRVWPNRSMCLVCMGGLSLRIGLRTGGCSRAGGRGAWAVHMLMFRSSVRLEAESACFVFVGDAALDLE